MDTQRHVVHTFPPVIDGDCRILILGSVPSIRSMQAGFYYMHPRNRFWRVLEWLLSDPFCDASPSERTRMLLQHHIALYDSVYACDIMGCSDSKVTAVVPADIPRLLQQAPISHIYCNGARSHAELLRAQPQLFDMATVLPSTSPANASYSLERLCQAWRVILNEP